MVFTNTGSRLDNPYSTTRSSSSSGGIGSTTFTSRKNYSIPLKLFIPLILVWIWFAAIISIVTESPELRKEVSIDIQREENIIKHKFQRGRLRAKEWVRNEKRWLKNRLDDNDPVTNIGPADPAAASMPEAGEEEIEEGTHNWDLTQLEDLALRTGPADTPIHIVFSTDCGPYQHWQAYQFFLSALRVRQPGRVTQIASGCTDDQAASLKEWHAEHVTPLSFRFGLHLTPDYSTVESVDGKSTEKYEFFNKPFGLKHWMEFGEGMGIDHSSSYDHNNNHPNNPRPWKHDTIIALLDPDQMLTRPITGHFSSLPTEAGGTGDIFRGAPSNDPLLSAGGGEGRKSKEINNVDSRLSFREHEPTFTVRHGHPLSQEYGFLNVWCKYASLAAGANSPATKVKGIEALRSYAVGPPYIATALDMYDIAVRWCEFVPTVYRHFPQLMAEMYAFSIATADLQLPHQLMASLMVSDTSGDGDGEGWKMVDDIPGEEVCSFAMDGLDVEVHSLPTVLNFCHRYGVGDTAFFAKEKVPANFFSCESSLLEEPALDIGSGKYLYKKPPFLKKRMEYSAVIEKREAFMVCASTGFLNEAALYFKERHCGENDANVRKEIRLHDLPE